MGRKRMHPKKKLQPKSPKAKMEGLPVQALQQYLWSNRDYPQYFEKFYRSKELLRIYKLLIHQPAAWENGLKYEIDPVEKLHLVFGTDYRHIFTYEVIQDFDLKVGEYNPAPQQPPANISIKELRRLYKGDIVLIRVDTRDEDLKVDLQVLTSGLFQDGSDDFRNFRVDTIDIASFRRYLKLKDSDGIEEKFV